MLGKSLGFQSLTNIALEYYYNTIRNIGDGVEVRCVEDRCLTVMIEGIKKSMFSNAKLSNREIYERIIALDTSKSLVLYEGGGGSGYRKHGTPAGAEIVDPHFSYFETSLKFGLLVSIGISLVVLF